MKKKTTKVIENIYDSDGKLLKTIETITEEDIYDFSPNYPLYPWNPYQPIYTTGSITNKPEEYEYVITCGSDGYTVDGCRM